MRSGFIKPKTSGSPSVTVTWDDSMAILLYGALKSNTMLARSIRAPSMSSWGEQFRILKKIVNPNEIEMVLEWYIKHLKDEYVPKALSAKAFRMKFDSIAEAMKRDSKAPLNDLAISKDALVRAAKYDELNWPTKERDMVPAFIQISMNNYRTFDTALKNLLKELSAESHRKTEQLRKESGLPTLVRSSHWDNTHLVKFIIDVYPAESSIIDTWIRAVNHIAWKYPGWGGDILKHAFHYNQDRFQLIMGRVVSEYRGDGRSWSKVWEMLKQRLPDNRTEEKPNGTSR
jgi:hypothetical protein